MRARQSLNMFEMVVKKRSKDPLIMLDGMLIKVKISG